MGKNNFLKNCDLILQEEKNEGNVLRKIIAFKKTMLFSNK